MLVSYLVLLSAQFVKPKCNFSSEILLCVLHITQVLPQSCPSDKHGKEIDTHIHTHCWGTAPSKSVHVRNGYATIRCLHVLNFTYIKEEKSGVEHQCQDEELASLALFFPYQSLNTLSVMKPWGLVFLFSWRITSPNLFSVQPQMQWVVSVNTSMQQCLEWIFSEEKKSQNIHSDLQILFFSFT